MDGGDAILVLGYFVGFWMFLFNRNFRTRWIEEFHKKSSAEKTEACFDALGCILIGVGIPAALIGFVAWSWLA
jgi:hypothetical protein